MIKTDQYGLIGQHRIDEPECLICFCNKKVLAFGLCTMHYARLTIHGTTYKERKFYSNDERLEARKNTKKKYKMSFKGKLSNERYKMGDAYRKTIKKQVIKRRSLLKAQNKIYKTWKKDIINFYKNCPKGKTVDHIISLFVYNSKKELIAHGLHVPWNLQYLTLRENVLKGATIL